MIKIINSTCGRHGLSLKLQRCLAKYGVVCFNCESVTESGLTPPEFLLFEAQNIKYIQSENTIVITDGTEQINFSADKNIYILSNSAPADKAENIITCGCSCDNAVSISSIGDSEAFICINQSLETVNGETILPCEIQAELNGNFNTTDVIILCTVLIISGKVKNGKLRL